MLRTGYTERVQADPHALPCRDQTSAWNLSIDEGAHDSGPRGSTRGFVWATRSTADDRGGEVSVAANRRRGRRAQPTSGKERRTHPRICMRTTASLAQITRGRSPLEVRRRWQGRRIAVDGALLTNRRALLVETAVDGLGLAYVSRACETPRAEKTLVACRQRLPAIPGYFLYYPSRNEHRAEAEALVDFIKRAGRLITSGGGGPPDPERLQAPRACARHECERSGPSRSSGRRVEPRSSAHGHRVERPAVPTLRHRSHRRQRNRP